MVQKQNKYALHIDLLNKQFNKKSFCLSDINICVPYGSIVALVGKNGAGKTTSMHCMLNLASADSGNISILGNVFNGQKAIKDNLGVVLDAPIFSLFLSPHQIDNVLNNIYSKWDSKAFKSYLSRFDLPLHQKTKLFSFGMKKKLSLAIALAHDAKLLILDEITSGLDPVSRDDILDTLLDFVQNPNRSVLISSHITSDLEKIADYIVFIDEGKVVLSEQKDILLYDFGIFRCTYGQFSRIDKEDIIAYKSEHHHINILVNNKRLMSDKYSNTLINQPSLDEILLILTASEVKNNERIASRKLL